MMGLPQIKQRIKTCRSTVKITKVMQMVSTSKLQKMKPVILKSEIYKTSVTEIISNLLRLSNVKSIFNNDSAIKKAMIITISSDKGLCGALNSNLCKNTIEQIKIIENKYSSIEINHIGNKANSTFFHKLKNANIKQNYLSDFYSYNNINIENLEIFIKNIIEQYDNQEYTDIFIAFNHFKSVLVNEYYFMNIKDFIDLSDNKNEFYQIDCDKYEAVKFAEYQALYAILSYTINSNIICEHSLRMQAMDSATRNTEKLIDRLTTNYNKTRQAGITNVLIDVISGSQTIQE